MLETVLKYIIALSPLLLWMFDKTVRNAHKRRFFKAQRESLQTYINNFYQKSGIEFVVRDIAAREVTCRDDVGSLFLDFAIKHKCNNFFGAMHDFVNSWTIIRVKRVDDESIELYTKYKKKTLETAFLVVIFYYFISAFLYLSNDIFLWFFKYMEWVPFETPKVIFNLFGFLKLLNILIAVIVLLSVGKWVTCAVSLSKKLPVKFEQTYL